MYTYYDVPRLTTETPDANRAILFDALRAVAGVEGVILKPATHRFEIQSSEDAPVIAADVTAASLKVGFLAAQS